MKRTQIYLTTEQQDFLENMAFISGKKMNKKVTVSSMIRKAIDLFIEANNGVETETDLILKSNLLISGLEKARNQKDLLEHKDIFG